MVVEVGKNWVKIEIESNEYMLISHKDSKEMNFKLGSDVPVGNDYHPFLVSEKIGGITSDVYVRRDPNLVAGDETTEVVVDKIG